MIAFGNHARLIVITTSRAAMIAPWTFVLNRSAITIAKRIGFLLDATARKISKTASA